MRTRKWLAALLAAILAVSMLPVTALAEEETTTESAPVLETKAPAETDVCKIGETGYATLKDAVEAAQNGDTITLLNDVANGSGIIVPSGKNFTLDFNGKTYTVTQDLAGSSGTKSQCFQLLKNSTVTMKNGTIKAGDPGIAMIIQNYCNLTLDNMILAGDTMERDSSYTLSNNCGNVSVKNSTITTAKNGKAFDSCKFSSYAPPVVTVENSTISGPVELSGGKLDIQSGSFEDIKTAKGYNEGDCTISGGTFTSDPSKFVTENTAVAGVGKDNANGFAVGQDAIQQAVTDKKDVTITKGSVTLTNVPTGVTVANAAGNTGTVKVNGNTVAAGKDYKVPSSGGGSSSGGSWSGYYYSVNPVGSSTWKPGDKGLAFTAGTTEKLSEVRVDYNTLAKGNYIVAKDGTVTLKANYLRTLAEGWYTLTLVFPDGEGSVSFTVEGTGTGLTQNPETGDHSFVAAAVVLAAVSVIGMAAASRKK